MIDIGSFIMKKGATSIDELSKRLRDDNVESELSYVADQLAVWIAGHSSAFIDN